MRRLQAAATMIVLVLVGLTAVQAAPRAANNADPFAVPKGNSRQLVAFIQGLLKQHPADDAARAKRQEAIIKAAEKILAGRTNNKDTLFAARIKAALLQDPQELANFEESLKKGHKPAVRQVHARLLAVKLQRAVGDIAAFRKLLDEVNEFLHAAPLQQGEMELATQVGELAERTGDDKLAGDTYESMGELLADQPTMAPACKQMQACARRLKLVGNTMLLEGKMLDGKKLDWDKYRGKVVLIDFWATWCGPCMAEVRNIKESYQKYHDKGFEVVGISLDQMSSKELAQFVEKESVPWTICRDADAPHRMSEYYGISGIPNLILVGRDGKVVSLHVRGGALGPQIEKALSGAVDVAQAPTDKPDAKGETDVKKEKGDAKGERREASKKKDGEDQANAPEFRKWTDASGKHHQTAKFLGMVGKSVTLKREDGRTVNVPLNKLSDDDQEYVRQQRK